MGQPAEAEQILRDALRRSPRNGRILFALIESLKAQNKTEGLDELKRELDAAWSKAAIPLSLADL